MEEGPWGAMQRAGGERCPVEGGGGLHLRRRDDATWRGGGGGGGGDGGLGAMEEAEAEALRWRREERRGTE